MSIAIKAFDGTPLTQLAVENADNYLRLHGSLVFTGTYTAQANGGDTVDWTTVAEQIQGTLLSAFAYSVKPTLAEYVFKKGATLATWSLEVALPPGTELSNGAAYPTADIVHFEALISKFI